MHVPAPICSHSLSLHDALPISREQVIESAVNAVSYAKKDYDDVEFSAEDASRSDPEFLIEIFTAVIDAGATHINVPETVGYPHPWEVCGVIKTMQGPTPRIEETRIGAE